MPTKKIPIKKTPVVEQKTPHIIEEEELWADGKEIVSFTIPLQPVTKKNSQRIVFHRILPSKQYCIYESECAKYILSAWVGQTHTPEEWENAIIEKFKSVEKSPKEVWNEFSDWITHNPIDYGISISMRVYLRSWIVGDEVGYLQGLLDAMQHWGLVKNDSWFDIDKNKEHFLAGIDPENPRSEIIIIRKRHPKEEYRFNQEKEETLKQEKARIRAEKKQ